MDADGAVLGGRWPKCVVGTALVAAALTFACGGSDDEGAVEATPKERSPSSAEGSEPAASGSTADLIEQEKTAVVEAHEAAMNARIESAAPPTPDPDFPALEETHVDPYLTEWVDRLDRMAFDGQAIRYPSDSQLEIVEVLDVTFGWETQEDGSGGAADAAADEVGNVATLNACVVDDFARIDAASGDVKAGGEVFTVHETSKLRKVDGVWKVAERDGNNSWPGRSGCAVD